MVVLAPSVREQLGRLGLPAEAVQARLGELPPQRLRRLGQSGLLRAEAQAGAIGLRENRFAADLRDGRVHLPPAFSNPPPSAARQQVAPLVARTYATGQGPAHPTASDPLPHLLDARTRAAALKTIAVARRPELRERVGTAVGAFIADDGRTDGVLSIERRLPSGKSPMPAPSRRGSSLPPPPPGFGSGTIWEIMMAMDEAILMEAARLGLGQGSGVGGTPGYLEAMGLWSLTPDEGDPSAWMGFGRSTQAFGSVRRSGIIGVPEPEGSRLGGSLGTVGTVGPESQNESIDVQIMRIKRMIDKKTQMMELYSQSLSKYNSSANNIIGNMKG